MAMLNKKILIPGVLKNALTSFRATFDLEDSIQNYTSSELITCFFFFLLFEKMGEERQ